MLSTTYNPRYLDSTSCFSGNGRLDLHVADYTLKSIFRQEAHLDSAHRSAPCREGSERGTPGYTLITPSPSLSFLQISGDSL